MCYVYSVIVEQIINKARVSQITIDAEFVTGIGKIRKELYHLLKDVYQLDPIIPLRNSGMIKVQIT